MTSRNDSSLPFSSRAAATLDLGLPKCGQTVWARVARLHGRLSQNQAFTACTLAAEFEMSDRTVTRTLLFMRDTLGAPIEFDREKWTYRYARRWPFLPLVRVRPDEAYVLKMMQRLLPAEVGSPMGQALRSLLQKFAVVVGGETSFHANALESVVFPAALLGAAEQQHLPLLQLAIETRRELTIVYRKPGATDGERHRIRPHLLRFIKRHWVLLTHDRSRGGAQRTFVLKRIQDVRVTGTSFKRPKGFDPAKILAGNYGAYTGDEDHLVRIALRGPAAVDAVENPWHESQTHAALADGRIEITLRLNNLIEVKNDILRWGEHAEALAPQPLREAVLGSLSAAAAVYRAAA